MSPNCYTHRHLLSPLGPLGALLTGAALTMLKRKAKPLPKHVKRKDKTASPPPTLISQTTFISPDVDEVMLTLVAADVNIDDAVDVVGKGEQLEL